MRIDVQIKTNRKTNYLTVEDGQKFTNKVDVGGRYLDEWAYQTDGWTCVAYNRTKGDLPKTGR